MNSSFKVYRTFAASAFGLAVVAHQFVALQSGYRAVVIMIATFVGVASALSAIREAILELKK